MGHKSSLGKFKKIEIISSIFSDHNTIRLHTNYRKKSVKNTNTWRLNNTLLNNQEITEEIKKYIEKKDNENTTAQKVWDAAKAVLRGEVIAIQSYLKKQEISNKQPNGTPKAIRKKNKKTPKLAEGKKS